MLRLLLIAGLLFAAVYSIDLPAFAQASDAAVSTATNAIGLDPNAVSGDDAGQIVGLAAKAFKNKEWTILAGLLLTIVIGILRGTKVLDQLVPDYLVPWKTLFLAMIASIAFGLQTGQSWDMMLGTGITVGLVAVGGWESLGKAFRALVDHFRKPKAEKAE